MPDISVCKLGWVGLNTNILNPELAQAAHLFLFFSTPAYRLDVAIAIGMPIFASSSTSFVAPAQASTCSHIEPR
jgi:hypothetical protein